MKRWYVSSLLLGLLFASWLNAATLEAQIESLQTQLDHQKQRLNFATEDTRFSLGGRIRLDAVINTPSNADKYDYYLTPKSLLSHTTQALFSSTLQSSRLWFKSARDTPLGALRTLVEVDFYGTAGTETVSNSHNMRLRHAYVTLGDCTIGQTFSTFMSTTLADVVLLSSDIIFVRQPLLRFTFGKNHLKWDLAFENPETFLLAKDTNTTSAYHDDTFIDTVTRLRYESKTTQASLALLYRKLSAIKNSSLITHDAWGINGSFKYRFLNNDFIQAAYVYGAGIGRYVTLGYYGDGEIDSQSIRLLPLQTAHLSYTHWWQKDLRSTMVIAYIGTLSSNTLSYYSTETMPSAHINLRYTLMPKTLLSIEYIYAQRAKNSEYFELQRYYFSFNYIF